LRRDGSVPRANCAPVRHPIPLEPLPPEVFNGVAAHHKDRCTRPIILLDLEKLNRQEWDFSLSAKRGALRRIKMKTTTDRAGESARAAGPEGRCFPDYRTAKTEQFLVLLVVGSWVITFLALSRSPNVGASRRPASLLPITKSRQRFIAIILADRHRANP
jgi:hypothetical protein